MMSDAIEDGTGTRTLARVGKGHRLWTYSVTEPIGSERSLEGMLFGIGTGSISVTTSNTTAAPVIWLRNDDPDHLFQVDKIIYGYDGGTTNFNRTCFCLISYQTGVPSANETATSPTIENIARSGTAAAVTDTKATGYVWDGTGAGMTVAGGFGQIGNRIAKGDTSLGFIAGQIVLGQNDTMSIGVVPQEDGLFNAAIVYWKIPVGGRE